MKICRELVKSLPIEIVVGIVIALVVLFIGITNTLNNTVLATINNETTINETSKYTLPLCIIYGLTTCPYCTALKEFFMENNISYDFRDVYSSQDYKDDFMVIIVKSGLEPYVPTTVIVDKYGNVSAIVQGEIKDLSFWKKLLDTPSNGTAVVYVVSSNGVEDTWVIDRNATLAIREAVFSVEARAGESTVSEELVPLITSMFILAFIDSINPCAISTSIIISANAVALGFTKKKRYLPTIAFVAGVYIGYFIVGYFTSILAYHNIFLAIVIAFAVILVSRDIYRLRKGEISNDIACDERECLPKILLKTPQQLYPIMMLGFGAAISWSFMLCSAAPYLLFVTLLAKTVENEAIKFLLIGIYCSIIVLPILLAGITSQHILKTLMNLRRIVVLRVMILSIIIVVALNYLL